MKRETVWVMAITAGIAVANIYYNQPLLADMGRSFHASAQHIGFIPTLTQVVIQHQINILHNNNKVNLLDLV